MLEKSRRVVIGLLAAMLALLAVRFATNHLVISSATWFIIHVLGFQTIVLAFVTKHFHNLYDRALNGGKNAITFKTALILIVAVLVVNFFLFN